MNAPENRACRQYDVIYSLGAACGCALYLRQCDLRLCSGPVDWVAGVSFSDRVRLVEGHFQDWMLAENMTPPAYNEGMGEWYSDDRKTGARFLHDFPGYADFQTELAIAQERYRRRQARFYKLIGEAQRALIVWFGLPERPMDAATLQDGFLRLRKALGEHVDVLVIEHDGAVACGESAEDTWFDGALRHVRVNCLRPGMTTFEEGIQGDNRALVNAVLGTVSLRPDLTRQIRLRKLRGRIKRRALKILAGFVPCERWRKRLRGTLNDRVFR